MPAVMYESDIIGLEIFPSPVQSRQLTITRIELRNILTRVILCPSQVKRIAFRVDFSFCTDMQRKINVV
jgi:hypothetical protein